MCVSNSPWLHFFKNSLTPTWKNFLLQLQYSLVASHLHFVMKKNDSPVSLLRKKKSVFIVLFKRVNWLISNFFSASSGVLCASVFLDILNFPVRKFFEHSLFFERRLFFTPSTNRCITVTCTSTTRCTDWRQYSASCTR